MTQMFNPPHPGKVLREYLGDIDVTTAARRLHVSRTTLSRILNGAAGRATQGVRLLNLETDDKIAAAVIIPPEELKEDEPTLLQ